MRFSEFDFDVITSPEEDQRPPRRSKPPQEARREVEGDTAEESKPQNDTGQPVG